MERVPRPPEQAAEGAEAAAEGGIRAEKVEVVAVVVGLAEAVAEAVAAAVAVAVATALRPQPGTTQPTSRVAVPAGPGPKARAVVAAVVVAVVVAAGAAVVAAAVAGGEAEAAANRSLRPPQPLVHKPVKHLVSSPPATMEYLCELPGDTSGHAVGEVHKVVYCTSRSNGNMGAGREEAEAIGERREAEGRDGRMKAEGREGGTEGGKEGRANRWTERGKAAA